MNRYNANYFSNNNFVNLDEYNKVVDKHNQLFNQLKLEKQKNSNLEATNENLKNRLDKFNKVQLENEKLNKQINSYQQINEDYTREINKNKNLQNKLNQIMANLNQIDKEKKELEKNLKDKEDSLIKVSNNYKEQIKKNSFLETQIKQTKEKNQNLENKLNNFKNLENQFNILLSDKKRIETEKNNLQSENNKKEQEILYLKNNKNDLQNQLEKKHNKFIKINEQYEKNQNELNTKEKELKTKEKELSILKNEKNNLENEKLVLKNKIKEGEIIIGDHKKSYNDLQKKYNDYSQKFDGALNQFDKISKENQELKEEVKKFKKIEKEKNNLEKENLKLNDIINENRTKDEFLDKVAEEYYDAIIGINSINSLRNEGWEIKYNQERKEMCQKIINEETIKIGVLGLNNVGKSYLLSRIANATIPTGYSIETKGISIKYSQGEKGEEKGICILDSAGFETPLLREDENIKEENIIENEENDELNDSIVKNDKGIFEKMMKYDKKEDRLSKDKMQTERFIEHLIISLSDMIILVIGKLTRTEQRLITRIKNMAKNNDNRIRSIIIVHNLAQYNKKREVENHINSYLLRSATFNLKPRSVVGMKNYEDRFYFVEEFDKEYNIEIFHYIMAREETEAGKYYNNLTLKLIRQQYNGLNQRNEIDIPQKIKQIFCKLSSEIIGEKIEIDQLETIDENKIKLKKDNNKINDKKYYLDDFQIQDAYIDQDGNYLQSSKKFEPRYSLYVYREAKDDEDEEEFENFLLLRIEIPGNLKRLTARSTNKDEKYKGIVIKGYKEEDEIPEFNNKKIFQKIYDNRKYDEISYFIELKGSLGLNKNYPIQDTEIYKIHFNKKNKEKYFIKNNQKSILKEEENNKKNVEGELVGSGVYILKFSLTQNSF